MGRYRAGQIYSDYGSAHTAETYHEPDRDTFTGLYDHTGTPLHRQPEPIGYDPHRWVQKPSPPKMQSFDRNGATFMAKKSKPMKKRGKGKGC